MSSLPSREEKEEAFDRDNDQAVQSVSSLQSCLSADSTRIRNRRASTSSLALMARESSTAALDENGEKLPHVPKVRLERRRTLSEHCFRSREARIASDLAIEAAEELLDVDPGCKELPMIGCRSTERRKTMLAYNVLLSGKSNDDRRNSNTEDIMAAYRNLNSAEGTPA